MTRWTVRADPAPLAFPIPRPGTGRPSIDALYRQAGGDRGRFRLLVATTWPPTTTTESRRS